MPDSTPVRRGTILSFVHRLVQRRRLPVFYHSAYRLPLAELEYTKTIEPRRADYAVWVLREHRAIRSEDIRTPPLASYEQLQLVHTPQYLESLSRKEVLAQVFAADPSEIPVDQVLHTVRLACGGTIEGAELALTRHCAVLNTLGGFHHAAPNRGAGFCPINDIAVAVATLRRNGFTGQVVVLDLDAHPPEATAYPVLAHVFAGEDPTGPLINTHGEIARLVRLYSRSIEQLNPDDLGSENIRNLRRLLYGLHAILTLHFAQEDELYLSLAGTNELAVVDFPQEQEKVPAPGVTAAEVWSSKPLDQSSRFPPSLRQSH